jgi:hypothetical protein
VEDWSENVSRTRRLFVLTTIESLLLLIMELDSTDSDVVLGSTRGAEAPDEVPCNSDEDDDASNDRGE